jgi:hypothetical protein
LKNEKIEWKKRLKKLKEDTLTLIGDVFLSASTIAYMGAFPKTYRVEKYRPKAAKLLRKNNILFQENATMRDILGDELLIG